MGDRCVIVGAGFKPAPMTRRRSEPAAHPAAEVRGLVSYSWGGGPVSRTGGSPLSEPPPADRAWRVAGWLRRAAPFAVSVACLGLLLWLFGGRLPAVWQAVRAVNPWALVLAGLAYLLALYVLSARIGLVCRFFGIHQPTYRFFLYTLVGFFFNNFLPTSMGGDLLKSGYMAGRSGRLAEALLATFIDRVIGAAGIILAGSLGIFFFPSLGAGAGVLWLPAAIAASLVAVVLTLRVERWVARALGWLQRAPLAERLRLPVLARAMVDLARAPGALTLALLLTLASVVVSALALWITARALGIETGLLTFLLLVPVMTVASMLPSINGVGVREATFVVVLRGLVPEEEALALAIVFYGLTLGCSLLGGVTFLLRRPLGLTLSPLGRAQSKDQA